MLRIKEIAKNKGITITELAEKLNITQTTLSRTINGNPTLETLLKIANVLDVDVRELITPTKNDNITLYMKHEISGEFIPLGEFNLNTLVRALKGD